jgi:hypothetical protein
MWDRIGCLGRMALVCIISIGPEAGGTNCRANEGDRCQRSRQPA